MAIRSKRYSIFFTRLNTKLRDIKLNNQFSLGLTSVENLGVEGNDSKKKREKKTLGKFFFFNFTPPLILFYFKK